MSNKTEITNTVRDFVAALSPAQTLWVAYSGGVDSHVLLDSLQRLRADYNFTLKPVHINHGLQPKADAWQQHCANVCAAYGLDCQQISLHLRKAKGDSMEALARTARYDALSQLLAPGDSLCTAQHADDQVESFFLQLLRGAGIHGLAAMPTVKSLGQGVLCRPLLHISKQQILDYAKARGLQWVDDDSNADLRIARNYLRKAILSPLAAYWPNYQTPVQRSIRHCQDSLSLLNDYLAADVGACLINAKQLQIQKLIGFAPLRQQAIVRHWLQQRQVPLPSTAILQRIITELIQTTADKQGVVQWADCEVRRFQAQLYLLPRQREQASAYQLTWQQGTALQLPAGIGNLKIHEQLGQGIAKRHLTASTVIVQNRRGGERIKLYRNAHRRSLKNNWQAWQIPPWWRDQLPLVYCNDELVAVAQFAIAEAYQARDNEIGVTFYWQAHEESV